jgi:hypothetical protein
MALFVACGFGGPTDSTEGSSATTGGKFSRGVNVNPGSNAHAAHDGPPGATVVFVTFEFEVIEHEQRIVWVKFAAAESVQFAQNESTRASLFDQQWVRVRPDTTSSAVTGFGRQLEQAKAAQVGGLDAVAARTTHGWRVDQSAFERAVNEDDWCCCHARVNHNSSASTVFSRAGASSQ